jgi:tellurite resistance protein TerC
MCLIDIYKIPVSISLAVVIGILILTMVLSVRTAKPEPRA